MEIHYLIRSKIDGKYLVARPQMNEAESEARYLLMFREHFDALSYLNTHGGGLADRFAVESLSANQVKTLLQRWGYKGVAVVVDPILPRVDFLSYG